MADNYLVYVFKTATGAAERIFKRARDNAGVHTDVVEINGAGVVASESFMPVAAAYTAGDIIDVPKELVFRDRDNVPVPAGSLIRIMSAVVKIDQASVISGETSYGLQLYSVTPPSGQADNAAWTLASADLPSYRGALDLGAPVDLGNACYVKTQFSDKQDFHLAGNSLFGRLITTGAATYPATARQVFLYGLVI